MIRIRYPWLSIQHPMAVRQESAAGTGRVKRPRIQVVISEPLNDKIEELSKERGESVSATARWILERHFENPSSRPAEGTYELKKEEPDNDAAKMVKLLELMKSAKAAGLI